MFTCIIVAIDGSEASKKALETACSLSKCFGAALHLVHSPQVETTAVVAGYSLVDLPVSPALISEAGAEVMEAARARAIELGAVTVDTTIGREDPARDVLSAAKLNDADLIVMGRRGLGSVASLFLGSISQAVSRDAECSVLTVAQ